MSEHKVIVELRSIVDRPVDPPQALADDLWRRIESELESATNPLLTADSTPDAETSADVTVARRRAKRSSRNPMWAAAAAFSLVLGFGLIVWWLLPGGEMADDDRISEAFTSPGSVVLAAGNVLWPGEDMAGTPSSVAEVFAVDVLGWNQVAAAETEQDTCLTYPSRNAEICPTDATTVTLTQDGVDPLTVVLDTIGRSESGRLWAVAQVGSGYTADRLQSVDTGIRIPLSQVERVVEADITMRLADVDDLVEVNAATAELEDGFVDTGLVSEPDGVLSVLVRYRDAHGHVITAEGGPWNQFYDFPQPEPAEPEVTIAEGTYQDSDIGWRMSAFETTEEGLCIQLEGMGCVGDIPPDEHLEALLTSSGFEAGGQTQWCAYGTVRDADSVQLLLSDGSQVTAPIYTNPAFDVDFYAYCSLGDQPPNQAIALDADGRTIDATPETNSD